MDSQHGGDDSGTVGDGTTDDGSGGDGGSGEDDGECRRQHWRRRRVRRRHGSGGGPGQDWAFELADFNVTVSPDGEYVELAYTGESERDISGYLLYDSEGGRADPTAQGTLDPFAFPEGTVLSFGASVRVYTGEGDGDDEFYGGYGLNIWAKTGDTFILEDTTGSVVFEREYPTQEE